MQPIKIGIIGLGKAWEQLHAPAFAKLTDKFKIMAVCDTNHEKAKTVAKSLDLPQDAAYNDYNKMLAEADIEAVDTIVPIPENYECAKAVIQHGKHIIAEKPLAADLQSAAELIILREKAGITMLVAENSRYDEENVIIKNLLEERVIGNPVYFIDNNVTEFQKDMLDETTFASTPWRMDADFKGGIFLDSGVHHVARHRFLFGGVRTLYAIGRPSEVDFAPYSALNALLTFDNNVAGHYSFFVIGKETQHPAVGFRIFGTHGEIYLENKASGIIHLTTKDGSNEKISYTPNIGYLRELKNFYDAIRNKKEITSTPEKALGDMEVIFGMLQSVEDDKRIRLT
ncbi:MAG: Gfo/Idh/MocA family oxidoreductase [Firmicutes bacterium]|nr:Gfo/Idh/MocA family oxidoreductase [Bacillota bacterium]